ncbi:hypothetical protein GCM10027615_13100 [Plantactinospora veratri]
MFLLILKIALMGGVRWTLLKIAKLTPVQSTTQEVGATATPITIAVSFHVMAWVVERILIGACTLALTVIVRMSASTITRSSKDLGGLGVFSSDRTVARTAETATRPRSGCSR